MFEIKIEHFDSKCQYLIWLIRPPDMKIESDQVRCRAMLGWARLDFFKIFRKADSFRKLG